MHKIVIALLAVVAVTSAGVVNPVTRCGGIGTFRELRISDCEGHCSLNPGTRYDVECHFTPSGSSPVPALTLKLTVFAFGVDITILETVLPYPSVGVGLPYNGFKFSLTPNDLLSGQTVTLTSKLSHTPTGLLELCLQTDFTIN